MLCWGGTGWKTVEIKVFKFEGEKYFCSDSKFSKLRLLYEEAEGDSHYIKKKKERKKKRKERG